MERITISMCLNEEQKSCLCAFAGVAEEDQQAVAVLLNCWERARTWYENAGCDLYARGIDQWVMDLAAWFYDNRGRSDAVLPPVIVNSVHHFRPAGQ